MFFAQDLLEEQHIGFERCLILLWRITAANGDEVVFALKLIAPERQSQSQENTSLKMTHRDDSHADAPEVPICSEAQDD